MKKTFMSSLTSALAPLANVISRGFKWLLGGLQDFFKAPLTNIWNALKTLVSGSVVLSSWLVLFEEFGKKILGWLALITGISSGAVGAKQIFDFARAVINPQEQMLDWLNEALSSLPSLSGLLESMDATMYRLTSPYFTPPLTMTYLLQVTGVGECFNQYLQALIQTLIFVFSIFIVRWAFSNNFTFTKEVPRS